MSVRRLNEERFTFQFNHKIDFNRTLEGGPWIFDKQLIILNKLDGNQNPCEVDLNKCVFIVFIHDLPYEQRSQAMAQYIGNSIGEMVGIDWVDSDLITFSSIKIKIWMDVTKALRRVMKL
ncbi:UNVERIFIED_CONTAM: hypothetical protein Slati_2109200 [Sesamum latifolium]|uniref:DUF4283 domain-containing protein n=1 Tax=Sesamum latifolium TaxID=2727402 RepID=A0AAW2WUU7_9LAMI